MAVIFAILFAVAACGGGGSGDNGFIPDNSDSGGDTGTPLAIATTALPNAIDGVQYTTSVQADGGEEPYSWAIVDDGGTGLTINNEGFLSGIAPQSGDYGLSIQVTDSAETTDKISLILTVTGDTPQPLAIATTSLPNAQEKEGYSAVLEAVGGQGAYQWTLIDNGNSGLQLRPDGLLNGTAPGKGQYPITVAVQDDTREVSSILILTVSTDSDALAITTTKLPGGNVGEPYAAVVQAAGGNPPYSWTLVSSGGSNLILSKDGVLSGTPTQVGTFGLVFRVSDGKSTDQLALTLSIFLGQDTGGPLKITTDFLPFADRVLYAAVVEAAGGQPGTAGYSWVGKDTSDPGTGFTMDGSTGSISGNTNDLLPGQYGYSVEVRDTAGGYDQRSYVITVPGGDSPPVRILTENLPPATVAETYSVIMRAVGGTGDTLWKVLETLNEDGTTFAGGPTFDAPGSELTGVLYWPATGTNKVVAGNYVISIKVTDEKDESADTKTYNLQAIAAPIRITTDTLPNAFVGSDYITELTSTGGGQARTWTVLNTVTEDGTAVANGPTFATDPGNASDGKLFWSRDDIEKGLYRVTINVTSIADGVTTEDTVTLDLQADP